MADQHWVARKLEKILLSQPRLTHAEAWDHMKVDYNVILSDKMMYRGLRMARKKYVGNEKAQYGKLRDYLNEIHRSNEGSSALLAVEPIPQSPSLFDKLYICLNACKRGFKAGYRPLIGLDGCFLKGFYGGQLLSAVGQDANNHFYVIAYAVVDNETKGLLPALKEVMPNAHHRNCVRHIWKNFTNKYKDTQLKNVVWACVKSSTVAEFNDNMQRLKRINEDAWAYLAKLDPGCWTKSKFSHYPKLDNITNNMTEVWNAKIVHYRGKPILTMLEELRCYIMRRMAQHKKALSMYTGIPCVHAMAAIAKRGDRPDTYVHKWLKMDAFRATYGHSISPVNSEEYWENSGEISSIPPKIKRPIGRPVKRRRRDPVEDRAEGNKAKKTFRVTCGKCGETGHNAKTCKGASKDGTNPKGKVKGKSKEKSTTTQEEVQVSQSAPVTELDMCDNILRIQVFDMN
ncbi:uncharacterized protein [Arachis hypogaea]|uniref:uncharacterized protein n=1 Tax=Arachis hypogaea TaxID=3818 RepID=UPI000DEC89B3|nr:uncharacterized protein LOC112794601 [Arachis hypogaea]